MKIIVNDANILINLADLDLLNKFTELDVELHTNDFVLAEVKNPELGVIDRRKKEQILKVNEIIKAGKLIVAQTPSNEYQEILKLQSKNLSFTDCSIWYYTKKMNGILLTGDNNLRKTVKETGTEVRGILYVFDILLEHKVISSDVAYVKLELLLKTNARLPKNEVHKRLQKWSENKNL